MSRMSEQDDDIRRTELFKAMKSSGRYSSEDEIAETILEMRVEVSEGVDPEVVLHEEGFEPDYIFDIIRF